MNNIIKPSISFLPMDDIAALLRSDQDGMRFMTRDDKANDVENVAGKDAKTVAIAVSPDNRTTVENAQKLNGKDASEYLSSEEGKRIIGISNKMSKIYSSEIRNLRDDLLCAKTQLIKNGFISDSTPYEGFTDSFKKSNIKYEGFVSGIAKAIIGNTNELFIADTSKIRFFEPNKKFIIRRSDLDQEIVVTSQGVTESGKVTFTPTVNILDSIEGVQLLKSNGEYVGDSYSFSEVKRNVANPLKNRYYMQQDDTRTAFQIINNPNTGYAVFFKVPATAAGALTQFSIRAQAEGTPGSLLCHVLKKEAVINAKGDFDCKFKNIEDAKEKGYWIATSAPIAASNAREETELYFDFFNVTTNKYPRIDADQYLFIIECYSAAENDYWKIRFSYFENGNEEVDDLERYNHSYFYNKINSSDIDKDLQALSIINDIDKYDMLFTIATRELIDEDEMGKQEGVYTAKIVLPRPLDISRLRLTTRINREGLYYLDSYDTSYTVFTLKNEKDTSYSVNDSRFKEGDLIVIGNQIGVVKRMTSAQVELQEPLYIDERISKFYSHKIFNPDTQQYETITRIPVYRVNYKVFVKPSLIDWNTWDNTKNQFLTKDISEDPIELKFSEVIPDGQKENIRISDRLIFEGDFGKDADDMCIFANEFEVQIQWKSPYAYDEINNIKDTADNNFKELIGRLHDIILTGDKVY